MESVRQDASIGGILHLFRSSCHEVIPVLDQAGEIVGLLHRHDIVRMLLSDAVAPDTGNNSGGALPDGHKPHFMNREGLPANSEKKQPPGSAE